jgi:ligand-binding sensor domain-containing protein
VQVTAMIWFLAGTFAGLCSATAANYSIRTWVKEDGLPQNSVTALVQTHDGYLWLGTYAGLVRFDGVHFTVFDNENAPFLKNGRITSLFEDRGHTLWIGHETGDLTRMREGRFEAVEIPHGWSGGKILRIGTDDEESLWIMNKEGLLACVKDGRALAPDESRRAGPGLVRMEKDKHGKLWILRGGELGVLEHGQLTPVDLDKSKGRVVVDAICPSRDGGLWIENGRRLRKWKNSAWADSLTVPPEALDAVTALQETPEGGVLVGTPAGIISIQP